MRELFSIVLLALSAHACAAQPQIRIERNAEGMAVSAAFTGKSNVDRLELTPRTLDTIAQLTELRSLSLWGTSVSDSEIASLLTLKQLVSIDLSHTNVTGEVLTTLSKMPNLVMINLQGCDVNDKHLELLSDFDRLMTLRLANTEVTDDGLRHIQGLKNLDHLDLSTCDISDAGLRSMGHLPALKHLWLSKTIRYGVDDKSDLTDGCVNYLASLKTLIDLQIADSQLTEAGLKRLRAALPEAKISTVSNGVLYVDQQKPDRTKR